MDESFSVVTVLRYDPAILEVTGPKFKHAGWNHENASPFYLLNFHHERMLRAVTHFQWQPAIDFLSAKGALQRIEIMSWDFIGASESPMRLKILINRDGAVSFEKGPIPSLSLENLFPKSLPSPGRTGSEGDAPRVPKNTVVIGNQGTQRSEHTHYKTTLRGMYDSARQRVGIVAGDPKEVLILDAELNNVAEASLTTPYFWRNHRMVTPPVSKGFSEKEGSGGIDGVSRRWALER